MENQPNQGMQRINDRTDNQAFLLNPVYPVYGYRKMKQIGNKVRTTACPRPGSGSRGSRTGAAATSVSPANC